MPSPNKSNINPLKPSTGTGGANVIGPAPDGTYTDGLFTDLTATTPTGTFADKVNEVLKSLAPSPAPDLSSASMTVPEEVRGKLSFGVTAPLNGYTSVAGIGNASAVDVDGLYDPSGNRYGITGTVNGINGQLAVNAVGSAQSPTPAYPAHAFSPGNEGTLILEINGNAVRSVDLSAVGAVNDNATGFILSQPEPVQFASGDQFPSETYRTGSWLADASQFRHGWNYIRIRHVIGEQENSTPYLDFVWDADTTPTTFSSETFSSLNLTGLKWLSGVDYYTGGSAHYSVNVDNAYRNSYVPGNAVTYSVSSALQALTADQLPPCYGDEGQTYTASKTATLKTSGIRLIDAGFMATTTVARTVQDDAVSAGAFVDHILLDNVADSNTIWVENFTGETYRLRSDSDFDSPATSGNWDSSKSLYNGGSGYNDGLQLINGQLLYPSRNFSSIANGPAANRNYTACSGVRYFCRAFFGGTLTHANFQALFQGVNVVFIPVSQPFSAANQMKFEIKCPSQTGWMDAYADFETEKWADGAGARKADSGLGRALGVNWGLTIGWKNTANSGNRMFARLTVPQGFNGYLSSFTFNFI